MREREREEERDTERERQRETERDEGGAFRLLIKVDNIIFLDFYNNSAQLSVQHFALQRL